MPQRLNVRAWRRRRPPGTLCIRRDARTPLVVTPMQAVSTGPRRAPRSILPLMPQACLTPRLTADTGGDGGCRGGPSARLCSGADAELPCSEAVLTDLDIWTGPLDVAQLRVTAPAAMATDADCRYEDGARSSCDQLAPPSVVSNSALDSEHDAFPEGHWLDVATAQGVEAHLRTRSAAPRVGSCHCRYHLGRKRSSVRVGCEHEYGPRIRVVVQLV